MDFIYELLNNRTCIACILAWFLAQFFKTIIYILMKRRISFRQMFLPGGMPSSHTAIVTALVASLAFHGYASSPYFAVALALAMVVIYDAVGVRYESGRQSVVLNMLIDEWEKENNAVMLDKRLKEVLGHRPIEVVVGAILGIVVGWIV